jgi:cyclophilin family peptidyl-prolyl cis-trans isomerase
MRVALPALLTLLLLTACSQTPVQPAPAQTAPAGDEASPYPVPPPPTAPPPQVQPPAPAKPAAPPPVHEVPVDKDHREVLIHTNLGDITLQLDATQAPLTVKHFLTYVKERYYDGSAFYRVIPGFVIQAGDYAANLDYHPPKHKPVPFEKNALSNLRGSVAMAHDQDPNSANAAFFIDLQDNIQQLAPYAGNPGYVVFGQVVAGLDVVDKIAAVRTTTRGPYANVPMQAVVITKATLQ